MGAHHNSGPAYGSRRGSRTGATIEIEADDFLDAIRRIRIGHPERDRQLRMLMRDVIVKARRKLIKDAKANLDNDPRQTYRAVKSTVYRALLGGNVSLLNRGSVKPMRLYNKKRTLQPGQHGGNRIKPSDKTKQMDSYFGADRAFVLRFSVVGTSARQSRFGNRGSVRGRDWFSISTAFHMKDAIDEFEQLFNRATEEVWNSSR